MTEREQCRLIELVAERKSAIQSEDKHSKADKRKNDSWEEVYTY